MKLDVSQEAIDRTTKCPHNMACLETGQCPCRVLFGGEKELILKIFCAKDCPYSKPYDLGVLCTCPVHCELDTRIRLLGEKPKQEE